MFGKVVISLLSTCPPVGRALLRGYFRAGGGWPQDSDWVLEALKRRLVPQPSLRSVQLNEGSRLEVDLATTTGREVYYHGSCEPAVAALLSNFLKPGMTFIDAGANLGEFTVRAARLVGTTGRVYALEASPGTAQVVQRNVDLNRLENVRVLPCAVCDKDEPTTFYLGRGEGSGSSSLTQPHDYTGEALVVRGQCLDTLATQEGLTGVDCVKLDIEGAELIAFRGATRLLSGIRPPLLIFEYHQEVARRGGWSFTDAALFLRKYNYQLGTLTRNGQVRICGDSESLTLCNLVGAHEAFHRVFV